MVLGTHGQGRLYLKYRVGSRYLLWFEQVAVPRKYLACPAGPPARVVSMCKDLQLMVKLTLLSVHRTIEFLMLEMTSKIIKSNC